jgi:hypothetical protein
MSKPKRSSADTQMDKLFESVVSILEQARGNVVRAVNTQMVMSYWLIGREIVEGVQGGEERAIYGKKVVEGLSTQLTERYGKGFSITNLWYFRQFYLAFQYRLPIPHPAGGESTGSAIAHPSGVKSREPEFSPNRGKNWTWPKRVPCWMTNHRKVSRPNSHGLIIAP